MKEPVSHEWLAARTASYLPLLERSAESILVMTGNADVVAMSPAARALHGVDGEQPATMTGDDYRERFEVCDPETRTPLPFDAWPLIRMHRGEPVEPRPMLLCSRDHQSSQLVDYEITPLSERRPADLYMVRLNPATPDSSVLTMNAPRLRTVLEALPIGVWFTDTAGRIVLGNAAAQRIWGGARFVGPEAYDEYRAWWAATGEPISGEQWGLARALKGEQSLAEVIEIETFDGERKIIRNWALPFHDDGGRIVGALAVNEDISEQWRAEEQRERLAALVRSSTDAITAKTIEGIITEWNPGAARMYGFSRSEAVGSPVAIIIPDDRAGEAQWLMELVRRGEVLEQYETERITKDGRRLAVSLSLSPIRNAAGRIVGAATITRNIGELKEVEQKLRQQAQALEAADRRKDEFIAVLAHELRNPLSPIATAVDLIRARDAEGVNAEVLAMMARQVDHMRRLLDDLLDASRMARGMLTVKKQTIDFKEVVEHAVEVARPLLERRSHRLRVHLAETPLPVLGDHQRLVQVAVNLLTNAAKYTDPGGVVTIRAGAEDERVVLRIRDTGVGIPRDMLDRVFDLFRNPEQHHRHPQTGLGLGLTLVRSIVTAHGGTVRAESPGPGGGSEFVVALPRLRERHVVAELAS